MPIIDRGDMYMLFIDDHIDEDTYESFTQLVICTQCCEDYGFTSDMYPDGSYTAKHCPVCGSVLKKEEKE